jgi:hypothetical protein
MAIAEAARSRLRRRSAAHCQPCGGCDGKQRELGEARTFVRVRRRRAQGGFRRHGERREPNRPVKPRTLMSSIIRARSALTGRWEGWEVIGGSSLELKVAGPSMLGIGCPDRHALLFTRSPSLPRMHRPRCRLLPRERVRSWGNNRPSLPNQPVAVMGRTSPFQTSARRSGIGAFGDAHRHLVRHPVRSFRVPFHHLPISH